MILSSIGDFAIGRSVFQASNWNDIYPILPLIGVLSDTDYNRHKRWCRHFVGINFISQRNEIRCTFLNTLCAAEFHFKQRITSVAAMKHCVAFQSATVAIMVERAIQRFCVDTQVAHHKILKKQTE